MKYRMCCESCGEVFEHECSIREFPRLKKEGAPCPACFQTGYYSFDPGGVQFSFKGDAWADKNYKEKSYRTQRSAYMAKRQEENHHKQTLVPNYKGEETGSWEEAKKIAASEGKFSETYDHLVRKEQNS